MGKAVCPFSAIEGLIPTSELAPLELSLLRQHADATRLMCFVLELFFGVCFGQCLVYFHPLRVYHEPRLRKKPTFQMLFKLRLTLFTCILLVIFFL